MSLMISPKVILAAQAGPDKLPVPSLLTDPRKSTLHELGYRSPT